MLEAGLSSVQRINEGAEYSNKRDKYKIFLFYLYLEANISVKTMAATIIKL